MWHSACHKDPYFGWYVRSGVPGDYDPTLGLPDMCVTQQDGSFIPPPADLANLVSRALNCMMPQIRSGTSAVNSVIELKDFKSLPRSIDAVQSISAKILGSKLSKLAANVPLRSIARVASDAFLQWKFNIAPLLSDIAAVKTALLTTKKRIDRLISRSAKLQRTHFATAFNEYANGSIDYGLYSLGPSEFWYPMINANRVERSYTYEASKFHAECEYSYSYYKFQSEYAQILGFLDSIGVNVNPAIIWNAIPWSFVVDWVIGVSRFLDNYKQRNLDPVIVIHRYLWSIRRKRRIYSTMVVGSTVTTPMGQRRHSMPAAEETTYRRSVGLPSASSITTSGLSLSEFSLGTALVFARRRARSRRW